MQQGASPCGVSDFPDVFCSNALCPYRQVIGRERYTSMQLTAANRLLEEGQHYLILKGERLEAEVKAKNEQLQQLDALAKREAARRAELEEELVELRRAVHARCSAVYSNTVLQETEVARVQQERKLLVEQVLQLQSALNGMVRLNEALQYALRSNEVKVSTVVSRFQKPSTGAPRCQSQSVSSLISSSSSSATHTVVSPPSQVEMPVEPEEDSDEVKKSNNTPIGDSKGDDKHVSSMEDKKRQDCHLAIASMRSAVSELESLRIFLNSLRAETSR
ncbi:hypothetical protein TraAM80_02482 [Trypanosoma rangeli]|uniref:Uncharacterized protein n=1 Tax=Trypanosoma rangeli TaxID=5698 RepID=A0A422NTR1_TRYRA|nr:uncharacterized protein TraAM80_02482 [Trypanosoma rangeli]RNF08850.1 hypothetical protein TraAM80_02482 [Trypanosoma rangeli]|eukprot:RNF08850.1 hypothetical protein TraAM80_02482 [Trypanosoma rangeli]